MIAFEVQGKTVTFTGDATAPAGVQALSNNDVRSPQKMLTNAGTVAVFVGWGETSDAAKANAILPTGTPRYGYYLLPSTQVVITAPPEAYFTGISASAAIVYITPGKGL